MKNKMISAVEEAKMIIGDSMGSFTDEGFSKSFSPVKRDTIHLAEKYLGLLFPQDYIRFLEEYGNIMVEGIWIYGIQDEYFESPMISDRVRATMDARRNLSFPDNLFIITDEDGEEFHCIDCSEGGGTIKTWNIYERKIVDKLADTFTEYLTARLEEVLD